MKDICTEFAKIPEIRVKMNRRVNDEEGGIKKLVVEVFQAIIKWAVAGRHVEKLKIILEKAEKVSGKYCCLDWLFC
jgi:hypothetical protein